LQSGFITLGPGLQLLSTPHPLCKLEIFT